MAKIADVRLYWTKSASANVKSVTVNMIIDGVTTKATYGPEVTEVVVQVQANKSGHFSVTVEDDQGLTSQSIVHDFQVGSLEAPQPVTGLGHEIVGIRDVA